TILLHTRTVIYHLSLHDALPICFRHQNFPVEPCWPLGSSHAEHLRWEAKSMRSSSSWASMPISSSAVPASPSSSSSALRALTSRSEEHTSELQSRSDIVCRLLLE